MIFKKVALFVDSALLSRAHHLFLCASQGRASSSNRQIARMSAPPPRTAKATALLPLRKRKRKFCQNCRIIQPKDSHFNFDKAKCRGGNYLIHAANPIRGDFWDLESPE